MPVSCCNFTLHEQGESLAAPGVLQRRPPMRLLLPLSQLAVPLPMVQLLLKLPLLLLVQRNQLERVPLSEGLTHMARVSASRRSLGYLMKSPAVPGSSTRQRQTGCREAGEQVQACGWKKERQQH